MAATRAVTINFIRASAVKAINKRMEGQKSFCDNALLESALNSPVNHHHYAQENDLARLAAILCTRLIKNHAFNNGNKRTALLATNFFLLRNGKVIQQTAKEPEDNATIRSAHNDVAQGKMDELELAEIYRASWRDATAENLEEAADLEVD